MRNPEIPFKAWLMIAAEQLGVAPGSVYRYITTGRLPYPPMRRVNSRVIFVPANLPPAVLPARHRPGEIRLKQFVHEEAARVGVTASAIYSRISRGQYPRLKLRRLNRFIVFVTVCSHEVNGRHAVA